MLETLHEKESWKWRAYLKAYCNYSIKDFTLKFQIDTTFNVKNKNIFNVLMFVLREFCNENKVHSFSFDRTNVNINVYRKINQPTQSEF